MINYYKVSLFTYNEFLKEYKSNNLARFHKIYYSKGIPVGMKINEIFETEYENVDYTISKYPHPEYKNEFNYTYLFDSKNGNSYRLDFVILLEDNNNLKNKILHDKKFISVGYSLSNRTDKNYDDPTDLEEQYDLLNRIKFLIKEFKKNINENIYIFMFGKPSDKKFIMYKYILEKCFPNYRIIKDFTSGFDDTKIGFYLIEKNYEKEL